MVDNEVEIIVLTNKLDKTIEIWMEPEAESIELEPNKSAHIIEIRKDNFNNDPLEIEFDKSSISIFEGRKTELKIFIDSELKYYTTPHRPRF